MYTHDGKLYLHNMPRFCVKPVESDSFYYNTIVTNSAFEKTLIQHKSIVTKHDESCVPKT